MPLSTLGASWHLFLYFFFFDVLTTRLFCKYKNRLTGALSRGRGRGKSFQIVSGEQVQVGSDPELWGGQNRGMRACRGCGERAGKLGCLRLGPGSPGGGCGEQHRVWCDAEPSLLGPFAPQAWRHLLRLPARSLPVGQRPLAADCRSARSAPRRP